MGQRSRLGFGVFSLQIVPLFFDQPGQTLREARDMEHDGKFEEENTPLYCGEVAIDPGWQPLEIIEVQVINNANFFNEYTGLPIVRNARKTISEGQTWVRARVVFDVESNNPP